MSENKAPGKVFMHFLVDDDYNYLTTSVGDLSVDGNILTLTTKNSIYTIRKLNNIAFLI